MAHRAAQVVVLLLAVLVSISAQDTLEECGIDPDFDAGLGYVDLNVTSNNTCAKLHFMHGLKLLNLFWYDLAATVFREAQTLDPSMAMAYWGEALSNKQSLWQYEDLPAAQAVLKRGNENADFDAITPLEAMYYDSVEILFSANHTLEERETAYAEAQKKLYDEYPDSPETCASYALSLLSMAASVGGYLMGSELSETQDTASALLDDCLQTWPTHAGLLHYAVHVGDVNNLTIAAAARAPADLLAQVANRSDHALHMRSHIYLKFGDWKVMADANEGAVLASDLYCEANDPTNIFCDEGNIYHSLEWAHFGLLHECEFMNALPWMERIQNDSVEMLAARPVNGASTQQYEYRMYAHHLYESDSWPTPVGLKQIESDPPTYVPAPLTNFDPSNAGDLLWVPWSESAALIARAAAVVFAPGSTDRKQQRNVQKVLAGVLTRLTQLRDQQLGSDLSTDFMQAYLNLTVMQVRGLQQAYACEINTTFAGVANPCTAWQPLMNSALKMEQAKLRGSPTAPSLPIIPAGELYGRTLVWAGENPTLARKLFRNVLTQWPNRLHSVLGLARASTQLGKNADAKTYYQALAKQCADGDADWPGLVEAEAAISR